MRDLIRRRSHAKSWILILFCLVTIFAMLALPLQQMHSRAQDNERSVKQDSRAKTIQGQEIATNDFDVVPAYDFGAGRDVKGRNARVPNRPSLVGTDQGVESEPNDTFGTADALTGAEGRIKGNNFSGGLPAVAGTDEDWYSFVTTVASSKVYAATMTSFSGGGTDTVLTVIASDGSTVLETDNNDGTLGGSSSSIAGTLLLVPGIYYLRVTNSSATAPVAPYELYFAVRSGAPTAETEPNNNGTPQALPASQYVSGAIDPVADTDTFTFTATAGDTVFISLDLDPERNTTTYNGRVGLGLLGTPSLFLVTGDGGAGDAIDSEAIFMTVDTTGTYQVYTDSQVAGGGGPTATYNFNVTTIPALPGGTCTTYTNATSTPIADVALTSSTITIPDSKIIRSLRVTTDITHTFYPDLDVHLRSPSGTAGNDNGLYTNVGASSQTGAQNFNLNEDAATPPLFSALNQTIYQPEFAYRLDWFKGENSLGTWTLDIRDDAADDSGTLNSWSLEVCEEPAPTGTLIYSQNFEANNGGYTLGPGVTANEWEYGTPATVATTTTNPVAPFLNCASGSSCWKTDLDSTYEINSSQDLTSGSIDLTTVSGTINLYWQARYQMESVSFDRIWVRVTQVGVPTNTRLVWHANNATMTDSVGIPAVNIPASAGWGRYSADISGFAGMNIQVTFHLESDSAFNFGGFAIDDVQIRTTGPSAAAANISGRITTPAGSPVGGAVMHLSGAASRTAVSDSAGNYRFENVETDNFYSVSPSLANYSFSPASRSFSLIGNMTEAGFTANPDAAQSANAIDMTEYFVRQQYLDFLGREPDQGGLEYWSSQINQCGSDATCIRNKRIDVSAAFFASLEFQQTGSYIYGLYAGTLGRASGYGEFMPDRAQVVGGAGLDPAKTAFAEAFVQRSEFTNRYPQSMSREQFVDAVLQTMSSRSGVDHSSLRDGFLSDYDTGGRALVVRHASEAGDFVDAEYNKAFVLMEYFGYLRRDIDPGGYAFWLDVLNNGTPGNYRGMVCAFLTSAEYQHRFSTVVTHSNAECGP